MSSDFKFSLNEAEYKAVIRKIEELADVDKKPVLRKAYKSGGQILITAGKTSFLSKNKKKTGGSSQKPGLFPGWGFSKLGINIIECM